MAAAPDWSQLPNELLSKIATSLNNQIENLQFRSVCQSWRSSALPIFPLNPNLPYPNIMHGNVMYEAGKSSLPGLLGALTLVESTIYVLQTFESSHSSPSCCFIQVTGTQPNLILSLLPSFTVSKKPTRINLLNTKFRTYAVAKEYRVEESTRLEGDFDTFDNQLKHAFAFIYLSKIALSPNATLDDFVVLAIDMSETLIVFRAGDEKWSVIEDQKCPCDLICYKGNFYAVDSTGETCIVDPLTLNTTLAANSIDSVEQKQWRFVESNGELFLLDIDTYSNNPLEGLIHPVRDQDDVEENAEKGFPIRCMVLKLDEQNKQWVEVDNLGDRIFFVDYRCSFSISASDLPLGCNGNCILFRNSLLTMRVFSLGDGIWRNLECHPCYFRLFSLPQLCSACQNESGLVFDAEDEY